MRNCPKIIGKSIPISHRSGIKRKQDSRSSTFYTSDQRNAFAENLKTATETANQRASELYATASDEAVERYKTAREAMHEQLAALDEAGDEAWEETKANVQEAWQNLKSATENLVQSDADAEEANSGTK
ncbi:MAG: hypothetical protein WD708_06575 [Kiritimatiellia bacterium]